MYYYLAYIKKHDNSKWHNSRADWLTMLFNFLMALNMKNQMMRGQLMK